MLKTLQTRPRLAFWLLLSVTAVIYLPALNAPFIFDDYSNIVRNSDIKALSNLKDRIFFTDFSEIRPNQNLPTRPLTFTLFTLEYAVSGLRPLGFHTVSFLLHALCAWMIFLLSRRLFTSVCGTPQPALALAVALLFAAHPVHMDAVAYASNQSDLLTAFLCLISLAAFPPGHRVNVRLLLSAAAFVLALGAKESAVSLPLLLLAYDFMTSAGRSLKKLAERKFLHLPFWLALAAFIAARKLFFGKVGFMGMNLEATWNPLNYFLTQVRVVPEYLRMTLFPSGLALDHLIYPVRSPVEPAFLAALGFWLLLAAALAAFAIRRKKAGDGWNPELSLAAFGAAWVFAALFPTSSVFPIFDALVERRLYLGGWGLSLLLLALHAKIFRLDWAREFSPRENRGLALALAAHILVLGGWTFARGFKYRTPEKLWVETVERYPQNSRAYNNLGGIYHERGDFERAEETYRKALGIAPDNVEALSNLAVILYQQGRSPEAYKLLSRILGIKPDDAKTHYALGRLFFDQGDAARARLHYEEAIRLHPGFAEAHANLAAIFFREGNTERTRELLERAIRLSPDYATPRINLGVLFFHQQKMDLAEKHFVEAIRIDPASAEAHKCLGDLRLNQNRPPEAEAEFQEAVRLDPSYAEAHDALGHLYYQQGRWDEALRHYGEVLKAHPERAAAHSNLGAVYYQMNREGPAEAAYLKALELDPTLYPIYADLGAIYENQKKFEKALDYYHRALKLNPNHLLALENLGDYYWERDERSRALSYYRRMLKAGADRADLRKKVEESEKKGGKKN